MFLLYHSDRCNTSETVFYWCYVNDLHTTHAVVCWVTTETYYETATLDLHARLTWRDTKFSLQPGGVAYGHIPFSTILILESVIFDI
jgi:hypothetical protein